MQKYLRSWQNVWKITFSEVGKSEDICVRNAINDFYTHVEMERIWGLVDEEL